MITRQQALDLLKSMPQQESDMNHYLETEAIMRALARHFKEDEEYVKEDISKRLQDHALFIAFAPVEDAQIVVAVIVENGGSGGSVAAPIARKIIDKY